MISQGKLKHKINIISIQKNIPHGILYQNFFFERFLERLSLTKYKNMFVLKGGYLISYMLGVEDRTTVDVDLTVRNYNVNEESLRMAVQEILDITLEDNTSFVITNVTDIRHEDKYNGYRFTIIGTFYSIKFHIKLDVSTGDIITPYAQEKQIHLYMSETDITLMSYNTETVLAEKIETILSRAEASTRLKDYYDIFSILVKDLGNINIDDLKLAIQNTFIHRNSQNILDNATKILEQIKKSDILKERWEKYREDNPYVGKIAYNEVMTKLDLLVGLVF